MSSIALLALSLGVICVGVVLAAITTRVNVTVVERGITAGRITALVSLLAIGAGIVGAVIALAQLLSR